MAKKYIDATPSPRLLQMLGEIPLKGWQCVAEFIDNSLDGILEDENSKNNKVEVYIPSPSEIARDVPLRVVDNGIGMSIKELEKAITAGYSGQSGQNKLGLFGMGFNVASSRLGNRATVFTSRKEDEVDHGVIIDLNKMSIGDSFKLELLTREDSISAKKGNSGTEIQISGFYQENDTSKRRLGNRPDTITKIKQAYSESFFNKCDIELFINEQKVVGRRFCTWSDQRFVKYKGEKIPAIIPIDKQKVKDVCWCNYCLNEFPLIGDSDVPEDCKFCGHHGSVEKREFFVGGWLGIQRFFHSEIYGVDIIRNGRVIVSNSKELFSWECRDEYEVPEEKLSELYGHPLYNDGKFLEYPIDNPPLGGRIVGEIYADFIKPTYTKDAFEQNETWKDALEIFKGTSPLQPKWATQRLGLHKNQSPLAKLHYGYRYTEPGRKNLVCGAKDGKANAGNKVALNYYNYFLWEDPEYIDDDKWYELVTIAERISDPDETEEIDGGDNGEIEGGETEGEIDLYKGLKVSIANINIDLETKLGLSGRLYKIFDWVPYHKSDVTQPIVMNYASSSECHVYLNRLHSILHEFPEGWEDLFVMEVSHEMASKVDDVEKWTLTAIFYEIKKTYFSERLLDTSLMALQANTFVNDLIQFLITKQSPIRRKHSLDDKQLKTLRSNYLMENGQELGKAGTITGDTGYLKYMDKTYLFDFIEHAPYTVFDNHFFDLPYESIEDTELKYQALKRYIGQLADVRWIIEVLPDLHESQFKLNKTNIIKAKLGLQDLMEKIVS